MIAPSHNVVTAKLLALCGSISGMHKLDVSGSVSLTSAPIREARAVWSSSPLPSLGSISGIPSRRTAMQFVEFRFFACFLVFVWQQTTRNPNKNFKGFKGLTKSNSLNLR